MEATSRVTDMVRVVLRVMGITTFLAGAAAAQNGTLPGVNGHPVDESTVRFSIKQLAHMRGLLNELDTLLGGPQATGAFESEWIVGGRRWYLSYRYRKPFEDYRFASRVFDDPEVNGGERIVTRSDSADLIRWYDQLVNRDLQAYRSGGLLGRCGSDESCHIEEATTKLRDIVRPFAATADRVLASMNQWYFQGRYRWDQTGTITRVPGSDMQRDPTPAPRTISPSTSGKNPHEVVILGEKPQTIEKTDTLPGDSRAPASAPPARRPDQTVATKPTGPAAPGAPKSPKSPKAPPAGKGRTTRVVRSGDTLIGIIETEVIPVLRAAGKAIPPVEGPGGLVETIAAASAIPDPDLIYPGQVIQLPVPVQS